MSDFESADDFAKKFESESKGENKDETKKADNALRPIWIVGAVICLVYLAGGLLVEMRVPNNISSFANIIGTPYIVGHTLKIPDYNKSWRWNTFKLTAAYKNKMIENKKKESGGT